MSQKQEPAPTGLEYTAADLQKYRRYGCVTRSGVRELRTNRDVVGAIKVTDIIVPDGTEKGGAQC